MGRACATWRANWPICPTKWSPGSRTRRGCGSGRGCFHRRKSAPLFSPSCAAGRAFLRRPVAAAVITVPAYFDDAQRQATRDAGRLAGWKSSASSTSRRFVAGLQPGPASPRRHRRRVRPGRGTFDVSILRLQHVDSGDGGTSGGVDQVLATAGDTHLGGDDVDRMIVELIQGEIPGAKSGVRRGAGFSAFDASGLSQFRRGRQDAAVGPDLGRRSR